MSKIHETAVISENAKIDKNVQIGPYCVIGDDVEIDAGCILKSHVFIEQNCKIGKNNIFYPFSVIGTIPQDLKFNNEKSYIEIGDNNTIREHVTIHLGTKDGGGLTKIGDNCLLMVGVHIAHDCIVANNVILANNAALAGHVIVEDSVVVGGMSAVHQFVRIGKSAMVGGMTGVDNDVIPYSTVVGERAHLAGLNLVGMKRKNIDRKEIHDLRGFFKEVFEDESGDEFKNKVINSANNHKSKIVQEVVDFINSEERKRQFCQIKK